MTKKIISMVLIITTLMISTYLGFTTMRPKTMPANPSAEFNKTLEFLAAITTEPHESGSDANYRVRDYIMDEAKSLGLSPEIQPFTLDVDQLISEQIAEIEADSKLLERYETYYTNHGYRDLKSFINAQLGNPRERILKLDNVLVKIEHKNTEGQKKANAVMLVSHYDSAPGAPGAGDDGIAVASMLSLMNELTQAPNLKNDVYLLFTDGEELNLLGAHHFVETFPQYLENVDILFNFEARGNTGALLMFETSKNNYNLVKQFNQSVPQPIGSSVMTAAYDKMPNDTDFTEFKKAGYRGLNFAMIGGVENYHQPSDNFENLNRDTAHQYHETVFALGNTFANLDLPAIEHNQEGVFFPFLGRGTIVIPEMLSYILGFMPLIMAVCLAIYSKKKRELTVFRVIGLVIGGVLPAIVTILMHGASYLLFIPMILFFITDALGKVAKNQKNGFVLYLISLLIAILGTAIVFVPFVYLMYLAFMLWYIPVILVLVMIIPTIIYSIKAFKILD